MTHDQVSQPHFSLFINHWSVSKMYRGSRGRSRRMWAGWRCWGTPAWWAPWGWWRAAWGRRRPAGGTPRRTCPACCGRDGPRAPWGCRCRSRPCPGTVLEHKTRLDKLNLPKTNVMLFRSKSKVGLFRCDQAIKKAVNSCWTNIIWLFVRNLQKIVIRKYQKTYWKL